MSLSHITVFTEQCFDAVNCLLEKAAVAQINFNKIFFCNFLIYFYMSNSMEQSLLRK